MNQEYVQQVLDRYQEKFDEMSRQSSKTMSPWTAVSHFQRFWDLHTDDFGKMFQEAVSESENLLDDNVWAPTRGITFLCALGADQERAVQKAFAELLLPDHSDYLQRQKRAEHFVETINQMLEIYECGEWKYRQSIRSAIMYLAFIEPDENYMYREGDAKAFARYVKYTEKIGSGKSFSLPNYYRLCDEISVFLQEQTDLPDLIGNALDAEAERCGDPDLPGVDAENHILCFDILHIAGLYDLYDISKKTARKKTVHSVKSEERQAELKRLKRHLHLLQEEIEKLGNVRSNACFPELKGKRVRHQKYGVGFVSEQAEQYLLVKFQTEEKRFLLPDAITKGFLKLDEPSAEAFCRHLEESENRKKQLEIEQLLVQRQIETLS